MHDACHEPGTEMKTLNTLVLMLSAMTAGTAVAVEEAKYTVALQQDKLEIRDYEPSIVCALQCAVRAVVHAPQ